MAPYDVFYQIWLGERHIGGLTAFLDPYNGVIDMGIMIGDTEVWGQGYGRETWEGTMNTFFLANPKLRKIEAGCMAANAAMRSICLHSGMALEATIPNHFYWHNKPMDMTRFGKMRA